MSLKSFHIAFILISLATGVFMAVWGYHDYRQAAQRSSLILAGTGLFLILSLIPYGFWFRKKMKTLPALMIGTVLLWPSWGWSCAVCFGDPQSLMAQGAKWGILALLVCIGGILISIAMIGWNWARRARKLGV